MEVIILFGLVVFAIFLLKPMILWLGMYKEYKPKNDDIMQDYLELKFNDRGYLTVKDYEILTTLRRRNKL